MIVGTWNLEWAPPAGKRGKGVASLLIALDADILCLTEAFEANAPGHGELIPSEDGNRHADRIGGKKVLLWSRYGWLGRLKDDAGDALFGSRIAAGIASTPVGRLRVVGVCIPYAGSRHMPASEQWQDHLAYLDRLEAFLADGEVLPTILLGDFNQTVPRRRQPAHVFDALMRVVSKPFEVATAGLTDADGAATIDHVACSAGLNYQVRGILPKTSGGQRLSDHFGVFGELTASGN